MIMEFRRNQEEMGGYNPPIRPSAFSKPLLPPTASLLGTPRSNGDVFTSLPVPPADPDPASVVMGVVDGFTATVTPSVTVRNSSLTKHPEAKYRECLRNHAASLGGYVLDGCGDFMAAGESEPLKCAACGCHRSFHRREVEGEGSYFSRLGNGSTSRGARVPLLPPPPPLHHHPQPQRQRHLGGTTAGAAGRRRSRRARRTPGPSSRKRFRSKFTTEQKKKMLAFAESVGWRMQKQDEAPVEQFCAEVGVRRQVLKVWMHNNKHTVRRQQQEHQQHQQIQHQHEHHHQQIQHQQQHHQQEHQQQQQQQHNQQQQQQQQQQLH